MAIYRHWTELPTEARGATVAIGNFDGVHRGHQAVVGTARRLADEAGSRAAVMTFEPHPRRYFQPDVAPFQLTPFRIKARLVESLGIDDLFVLPFTSDLSHKTPSAFAGEVLSAGLAARHVVVGRDFAFGYRQQGNLQTLAERGAAEGFGTTGVELIAGAEGGVFSSTAVRDYLRAGEPGRAAVLLGRYWEIEGRVQRGQRLGRDLGFPTANIALGEILHPAYGVYAVRAALDTAGVERWLTGVANLGVRPMVGGGEPLLEVHIFDYHGDLYGRHLRVALVAYLRPELTFADLEEMKVRMGEDCRRARAILAEEDWSGDWPCGPALRAAIEGTG
jgi:riboflavin kinase/FMN adenylyltransferase